MIPNPKHSNMISNFLPLAKTKSANALLMPPKKRLKHASEKKGEPTMREKRGAYSFPKQ
jgi:hypothetical protein